MSDAPSRVIIHADVDAFYASVEQRDNPDLRGRPVAVGGLPNHRGVVMTASYEARRFGVHSAMPSRTAIGLCPNLILVPPRFEAYQQASRLIMDVFRSHTPAVEPMSMDEAFLDLSTQASSVEGAEAVARAIKQEVKNLTHLTISLGVAAGKLVAKIASDYQKPDGLTVVPKSSAREFLAPMPVRKLWGVGPQTEAVLKQAGIERIGQLADAEHDWLMGKLGVWALGWRDLARGEDRREVGARARSKQISREVTFDRDTDDGSRLRSTLTEMARGLARSLESTGPARTVHIKLRYADFTTLTRQRRCSGSVTAAEDIAAEACALLETAWNGKRIRLIGVGLSSFIERPHGQLSLL